MTLSKLSVISAVIAAAILACAAAPSAVAATPEFRFEAGHTVVSGKQLNTHVLKTKAEEEVTCKTLTLSGTAKSVSSKELSLVPAYGECKFKSEEEEFTAHVNIGSCFYVLTADTETESEHLFEGQLELACEEAEDAIRVEITVLGKKYKCLSLAPQSPEGSEEYTNKGEGAGRELELSSALSGIEYTRESLCGEGGAANATYSGEATVSGKDVKEAESGVWMQIPEPPIFHFEVEHTTVSGEQVGNQVLKTKAEEEVTCKGLILSSTQESTSANELLPAPAYSECKFKSEEEEFTAHVNIGSCSYVLSATEEVESGHVFEGPLGISCKEPEDAIRFEITVLSKKFQCLALTPQTSKDAINYTNKGKGSERDFTLDLSLTGIEYTREGICGEGSASNATYSGEVTAIGKDKGEAQVGIWVGSPIEPPPPGNFHSESSHTSLDGEGGTQIFASPSSEWICAGVSLNGTLTVESSYQLPVTPQYENCEFFYTLIFHSEECVFILGDLLEEGHATLQVDCPNKTQTMHFDVELFGREFPCTTIPEQTPEPGLGYSNSEGAIDVAATISGLSVIGEPLCSESGEPEEISMSYEGEFQISGTNGSEEPVEIWWEE